MKLLSPQECEARMAEQGGHEIWISNVPRFRKVCIIPGSFLELLGNGIERVTDLCLTTQHATISGIGGGYCIYFPPFEIIAVL